MLKKISVLLVDDHPIIINAYKTALIHYSDVNSEYIFNIENAINCDEALIKINSFFTSKKQLEVVFLDIRLPKSNDNKILSGEDLALKIKALLPKTKIIISTTLNDNYRLHSLIKNINPIGLLVKNDINSNDLINAINDVLNNKPHYSKTVIKLMRKQVSNEILLDDIDRKLLYEISLGTKMKELPKILPLSLAGIEKRKRRLKQIFDTQSSSDKELLSVAKEKGFI